MVKKNARKTSLRFSVMVELLVGLLGFYGVGRLLAGRFKEARALLIVSLLLIVPLDLSPRIVLGDAYAIWLPWLIKAVLATASALQLNYVLARKERTAKKPDNTPNRKERTSGKPDNVSSRKASAARKPEDAPTSRERAAGRR